MIKNSKMTIPLFFASLALSAVNYSVASEPSQEHIALPAELYEEIITQSSDPYEAARNFVKLRATSKSIQNKLDPSTERIIGTIAQKYNVDPLIPAFYIGTPVVKEFYKKRMQEQKKKLGDGFRKYLSNVMEQVLIRYNGSKAFKELILNLLANGAYFRRKYNIKVKNDIWLSDTKVYEDVKNPGEELPFFDNVGVALQEEYGYTAYGYAVTPSYQRIGNTIVILFSENDEDGKIYCAITKLNLDLKQIGDSLMFTIPGKKGRFYDPISFYPQIDSEGYVIVVESVDEDSLLGEELELFFVDENGSNIKKIISMTHKKDYFKDLGHIEQSSKEFDGNPETPLFE